MISIQDSLSTFTFDLTSAENPTTPSVGVTTGSTGGISVGGVIVTNQSLPGTHVTFGSIDVTSDSSSSGINLTNNTGANVSFNNLGVDSSMAANPASPVSAELSSEAVTPTANYDPRNGEISFIGLEEVDSSQPSIAIFLESSLPALQFCTTDGGEANLFLPGHRKRFVTAEQEFLLWYYDDLSELPTTLDVGSVVEPGTSAEALNFLYWTSNLEFNFPFDRQAASNGTVVVVPEPTGAILLMLATTGLVTLVNRRVP